MSSSKKLYSVPVTQAQVYAMAMQKFHDQFSGSWIKKLLYIVKRILFVIRSQLYDLEYNTIPEWLLKQALQEWKSKVLDKLHYVGETFDCDDFARHFMVWLKDWINGNGIICEFAPKNEQIKQFNAVGMAIGLLYKDGRLLGGHAWNIVLITNSDGEPELVYVEPQIAEMFRGTTTSDGFDYELQAIDM